MKDFGSERVTEPPGTIPSMAWKLDNSREIGDKEMRVGLRAIKLEWNNFNQICSSCHYTESKIKARIEEITAKRGKLQNPYTQSSGVLYGVVDEVGTLWEGEDFKEGDSVISLTSTAGLPVHIDAVDEIDYDYGIIWCRGYAVLFESAKLALMPDDVMTGPFMCAIDAEGSLVDVRNALVDRKPQNIAIMGSNLVDIMLYAQMVRLSEAVTGVTARVIAIVEKDTLSYLSEKEFLKTFSGLIDGVYFADMTKPVDAALRIYRQEGLRHLDAVINLEDIRGAESIGALIVRDTGFLFHAGVKGNYFQSLIAADCLGKEIASFALDGYSRDACPLATEVTRKSEKNFKTLNGLMSSKPARKMIKHAGMWFYAEPPDYYAMAPEEAGDVAGFVEMILTHTEEEMRAEMEGYDILLIKYNALIDAVKDACGVDLQALGNANVAKFGSLVAGDGAGDDQTEGSGDVQTGEGATE